MATALAAGGMACGPSGVVDDGQGNKSAAIVLARAEGLKTGEAGGRASFDVSVTMPPAAEVLITITSSVPNEVAVSPGAKTLRFTPASWNAALRVDLIGQDDHAIDGDQSAVITIDASGSADAAYKKLARIELAVTNTDNDAAGLTVAPTALSTREGGGAVTFSVQPNTQPASGESIVVSVTSADTSEGAVSPAQLTFTSESFGTAQTVTVTPVEDTEEDGDKTYNIQLAANASTAAGYAAFAGTVQVTNADNDRPGLAIMPTSLSTREDGGSVTFTVRPESPIASGASVIVDIASADPSEGTVSPAQLVFNSSNFSTAQIVTVTPQEDIDQDGPVTYAVTIDPGASTVPGYAALPIRNVSVANADNDTPGITVAPLTLTTGEGGQPVTFAVSVDSIIAMGEQVIIAVASQNTSEGTVSPSQLIFDSTNYAAPQSVTVTPQDDVVEDGDQVYDIVLDPSLSSLASGYAALSVPAVPVTNTDDDGPPPVVSLTKLPHSATIDAQQELRFSFAVTPGSPYTISLSGLSDNVELGVDLDDSNFGSFECLSMHPGTDDEQCTLAATGATMYLALYGQFAVGSSAFTLDIVPYVPPKSVSLTVVPFAGTLAAGAYAYYTFGVIPDALYGVALGGLSDDLDIAVYHDSLFLQQLCSRSFTGTTDETCAVPAAGDTMYIRLDATKATASTDFTLNVTSIPIAPDSLAGMSLPRADNVGATVRFYSIPVISGTGYTVSLTSLSADVDLWVFDDDSLFTNAVSSCGPESGTTDETCTLTASGAALYFLVDGSVSPSGGSYYVDVAP